MPLSEDEQRILQEIEARLYEEDPALVREVSSTTIYTHAFRNIKWATLGFLAGAAFTVAALSTDYLIAFVGFLVMWVCAMFIVRNARKMGRAGWQEITVSVRSNGVRTFLGNAGERARGRFRRE